MFHNAHELHALYPGMAASVRHDRRRCDRGLGTERQRAGNAGLSQYLHRRTLRRTGVGKRLREDLAAVGIGHHAFRFELPSGLVIGNAAVEMRRSLDGERFG